MNYGPLEFARHLRRQQDHGDSQKTRAGRATRPQPPPVNLLEVLPAQDAGDCVAAAPLATAPIADER